jgi:hypothetical protein
MIATIAATLTLPSASASRITPVNGHAKPGTTAHPFVDSPHTKDVGFTG